MAAEPTPAGLWYNPPAEIEPTPLALAHLIFGVVPIPLPNWSHAAAVNCWVWLSSRFTLSGVMTMDFKVCLTVTLTLEVTDQPFASAIVT